MVTDYYDQGSLSKHPAMFKGNVLAALQALRPIIAALAKLHAQGIVHRDIKPKNIFVDDKNRLVLGDFGIVFIEDGQRPTELLERVGSRDWMPPWAHTGMRVDDVKPTFDVFSLGKVIWSMIAGREMLPYWYHRRPPYDLTVMFPNEPAMHAANRVLDHCIVEDENRCLSSAVDLLSMVDEILRMLARGGQLLGDGVPRPCRVCGTGQYRMAYGAIPLIPDTSERNMDVYACDSCGHIQMFSLPKPD